MRALLQLARTDCTPKLAQQQIICRRTVSRKGNGTVARQARAPSQVKPALVFCAQRPECACCLTHATSGSRQNKLETMRAAAGITSQLGQPRKPCSMSARRLAFISAVVAPSHARASLLHAPCEHRVDVPARRCSHASAPQPMESSPS
jgi:hypothetical protein